MRGAIVDMFNAGNILWGFGDFLHLNTRLAHHRITHPSNLI